LRAASVRGTLIGESLGACEIDMRICAAKPAVVGADTMARDSEQSFVGLERGFERTRAS